MISFIDLDAQQQRIRTRLDAAIGRVLDHGKYIMGPEVAQLEQRLSEFVGAKHCISVSNGTDALVAALMALEIGPGDAVLTTPFTFFATVEAIMFVGATPVFADIDPVTYNICPQSIERTVDQVKKDGKHQLRAIIPVDLFGLCADYDQINSIAEREQLVVIQDSAQAFGASTPDGRRAPTHGLIGTTSFFPAKPLGCYGDGGACFTDDDELAARMRSIRVHGKGVDKYDNVRTGQNCRLDTLQAAVLLEKLNIYQDEIDLRQRVAADYLASLGQQGTLVLPRVPDDYTSVWAQFTVRSTQRDALLHQLQEAGVPTAVYYRTPAHLLGACQHLEIPAGTFPEAEAASAEVFSLPFYPYLESPQVAEICAATLAASDSFATPR